MRTWLDMLKESNPEDLEPVRNASAPPSQGAAGSSNSWLASFWASLEDVPTGHRQHTAFPASGGQLPVDQRAIESGAVSRHTVEVFGIGAKAGSPRATGKAA